MSDAWMIPNIPAMGGGGIFATGSSGLGNAYASQASNNAYYAMMAQAQQAAQVQQAQLYGGGGFGAQPAYYAGLGAAYGRATGGFGGMGSVFDRGALPYNDYGGGANPGGFSPSPNYVGGQAYWDANPDVRAAGMDPFQHWQTYGRNEGRDPTGMDVSGAAGLYGGGINSGSAYDWNKMFSPQPSAQTSPWGGGTSSQPYGGYSSSPWEGAGFDAVKYLQQNPDVAQAGADPWQHAQQYGFKENRQGMGWNPETYLQQNADVRAAGVNPWEHAQNYGFKEGRSGLEGLTQTDAGRNAGARVQPGGYPGDIGFSRQPSYPNLGYNSSFGTNFTPQANPYEALYGAMRFPNSGTPSQYYTGDQYGAGGSLYGRTGALPPGFATPYSADNQGGALPARSDNWGQPWGGP